jgi:cyclic pyranopterin phosphate synthase
MAVYRTLRLSVTDRCNLRCRYCMPPEGVPSVPHASLPSLEELGELAGFLCRHLGLRKIRLTGGEPLVRRGLPRLVRILSSLPAMEEVNLTTNGILLPDLADELRAAGLHRVNLSLDTLDPGRYFHVTRGGDLRKALRGLEAARRAGLVPVKLNAVLRKSTFRLDVPDLLDFAAEEGLEIRFIELMETGPQSAWASSEFVAAGEVRERLGLSDWEPDGGGSAPSRTGLLSWRGRRIRVGWITPLSEGFCGACDRLRMDARGRLFRCLMDGQGLDLAGLWRDGGPEGASLRLAPYLQGKRPPAAMVRSEAMGAVGG